MDKIRLWAYGVTVAAVIGAVILSVAPGGATEKIVKTAVSLFLMCAILYPFISSEEACGILKNAELPDIEISESDQGGAENYLEEKTKEKISAILTESGIKDPDINISISIDNGNEMKINSVTVAAAEEYKDLFENAQANLKAQLGIEVQIEVKK